MNKLFLLISAAVAILGSANAAFELQSVEAKKYWREITGQEMPKGAIAFAIDPSVSKTGNDAYRIDSTSVGARITGSNERSVWYGLYDLLSRRGGCQWFWDGDIVPKKSAIDLIGLDVREESRYEYRGIREFAHRGLKRFQAEHWGPEEWKREIDWMLKRRLNCFMPRIGMDDTWQKAYPDIVPYPDPSKPLRGAGKGFDNRSCFWSLQYRGELRKFFTKYAFDRGMIIPTDYGTMTHWYARTPIQFIEKMKPDFFPSANGSNYGETDGLVWDIFKKDWLEKYWHLTDVFCKSGYGTLDYLHTIGLGERRIYNDRAKNHELKLEVLKAINNRALKANPNAKLLLAGWDMYAFWNPEEIKDLVGRLDPKNTIFWDYAGDSFKGRDMFQPDLRNDFTQWGLIGKFPYTFGFLFAYESALDLRGNYPMIADRVKIAAEDPYCRGWILWPETSHNDTLFLEYFTENAWRPDSPIEKVLPRFCERRYGPLAKTMEPLWRRVLPIARLLGWRGNYALDLTAWNVWGLVEGESTAPLDDARAILDDLSKIDCSNEFVKRDVVDLKRTVLDRLIIHDRHTLMRAFDDWREGKGTKDKVRELAAKWCADTKEMTKVLASHPDFSLVNTLADMKKVAPVPNPNALDLLKENAGDAYCRSHQYEFARDWYEPSTCAIAAELLHRLDADNRALFTIIDARPIFNRCRNKSASRVYSVPDCEKGAGAGYKVKVDGVNAPVSEMRSSAMPVNIRWPGHQRELDQTEIDGLVRFAFTNEVEVSVTCPRDFKEVVVRPRSKGIVPRVFGRTATFTIRDPGGYSVEFDGDHKNLHIFADAWTDYGVKKGPDTIYFGPGEHDVGLIELKTGQTLYIDEGAVVFGHIHAKDADHIRILGHGILDMSRVKEKITPIDPEKEREMRAKGFALTNEERWDMIFLEYCDDVLIDGIVLRDSLCYNIRPVGCRGLTIRNVKLCGNWRYNSDGIDMHNCEKVRISDCFIRTFDDSICVKGWDYRMDESEMLHDGYRHDSFKDAIIERCTIWCDWGRCLEFGAETRAREITDVTFRDCDIIHTHAVVCDVQNCDYADIHDVRFEKIRMELDSPHCKDAYSEHASDFNPVPVKGLQPAWFAAVIHMIPEYSKGDTRRGLIRNVTLKDIDITGPDEPRYRIKHFDDAHRVENVKFENIRWNGKPYEVKGL